MLKDPAEAAQQLLVKYLSDNDFKLVLFERYNVMLHLFAVLSKRYAVVELQIS